MRCRHFKPHTTCVANRNVQNRQAVTNLSLIRKLVWNYLTHAKAPDIATMRTIGWNDDLLCEHLGALIAATAPT